MCNLVRQAFLKSNDSLREGEDDQGGAGSSQSEELYFKAFINISLEIEFYLVMAFWRMRAE